jgi:hypothetical protein
LVFHGLVFWGRGNLPAQKHETYLKSTNEG